LTGLRRDGAVDEKHVNRFSLKESFKRKFQSKPFTKLATGHDTPLMVMRTSQFCREW